MNFLCDLALLTPHIGPNMCKEDVIKFLRDNHTRVMSCTHATRAFSAYNNTKKVQTEDKTPKKRRFPSSLYSTKLSSNTLTHHIYPPPSSISLPSNNNLRCGMCADDHNSHSKRSTKMEGG
jgi:hypothetical protein